MSKIVDYNCEAYKFYNLEWDTEYFGVNSAKAILNGSVTKKDQDELLNYCKDYNFITITNINNNNHNNYWMSNIKNLFLTDVNIQFEKELHFSTECIDETTEINISYSKNEKVLNIAKNAFSFSRFFNDPFLESKKTQDIYLYWTECGFDKSDKYFVITKRENEIAGYMLFSINVEDRTSTIELIAVDDKFKGKKVGKSLVSGLESFLYRNNIKKIKVGTQVNNVAAANFYFSNGFRYVNCNSVYHYWPSNDESKNNLID
ncbi:GNAT family N-acetyltransferase [Neobacillus vireti]|uniref:GNAT family N-acetyltransferase n=1 Tax=Neobacillus vireti TaxID=220686 RepID=UPI002FFFDD5B